MHEYGTLKTVDIILRRGVEEEEISFADEPNWDTIYVYMEISQ
jgi:hypothetical protein